MDLLGLWHYWVVIVLMMIGLYIVISRDNLVKKIMGLNIFQVSVIMFYVAMGKVKGGTAPIISGKLPSGHGDHHGSDDSHSAVATTKHDVVHAKTVGDAHHGAADARIIALRTATAPRTLHITVTTPARP